MKFFSASRNVRVALPCLALSHFRLVHRLIQQDRLQLADDWRGDWNEILWLAGEEVQLVQGEQPLELRDRIGSIVDSDVDEAIVRAEIAPIFPYHEQGGGLHASLVPSTGLTRLERCHEPVSQITGGALEGFRQVLHRLIRHHDVGLSGVPSADDDLTLAAQDVSSSRRCAYPTASPIEGGLPGKARRIPPGIYQPHLAVLEHRIGAHHYPEGLLRGSS